VNTICDEETAVLLAGPGGLCVADGVVNYGGKLAFVSDQHLGDDPEATKRSLKQKYARIAAERDFDALLPAHGDPIPHGGREALLAWAEA
jgi:glyoxylase-like metal-dependent hydrolase (beta-lactamase superfamily II)